MTGDVLLSGPAGGAGRARLPGAQTPLLDQEFDMGTLYALRATVQAHASQAGLSEDRVGEVVLAVHELAANAVAHGAGHGRLRIWDLAGALSFEVLDGGLAGGGLPSPAGGGPPGPAEVADPWPAPDGHGLWLVRQVAARLELRSGPRGTRAMVTFAMPPPEDH